jgi:hypothetical protein
MLLESSRSGKRWKSFQWFARESESYCSICIFRSCNKIKFLSSDAINMSVIRMLLESGIVLQPCIFKNILQILTHTYQSSSFHLRMCCCSCSGYRDRILQISLIFVNAGHLSGSSREREARGD